MEINRAWSDLLKYVWTDHVLMLCGQVLEPKMDAVAGKAE